MKDIYQSERKPLRYLIMGRRLTDIDALSNEVQGLQHPSSGGGRVAATGGPG